MLACARLRSLLAHEHTHAYTQTNAHTHAHTSMSTSIACVRTLAVSAAFMAATSTTRRTTWCSSAASAFSARCSAAASLSRTACGVHACACVAQQGTAYALEAHRGLQGLCTCCEVHMHTRTPARTPVCTHAHTYARTNRSACASWAASNASSSRAATALASRSDAAGSGLGVAPGDACCACKGQRARGVLLQCAAPRCCSHGCARHARNERCVRHMDSLSFPRYYCKRQ